MTLITVCTICFNINYLWNFRTNFMCYNKERLLFLNRINRLIFKMMIQGVFKKYENMNWIIEHNYKMLVE
jgi:hypothetical protein